MIQTGFESKVKIQQIIENQLPSYLLDESPNSVEFFKQYYISQEYQGGPVDIAENLDQYLKLDNLLPEILVDSTVTSGITSVGADTIYVTSTKGFPDKYGLLKINDEIITYTSKDDSGFLGCIRGFSAITSYHQELDNEELVFSTSSAAEHSSGSKVENISSLFLKEFYEKTKYTFAPSLQKVNFNSEVNVGNFLKNIRNLYEAKGTNESFRILFNVLYGVSPKIINLEDFLIKASSAEFLRREVVIAESISGNPNKLVGQTITKLNDSGTSAAISESEAFTRDGKQYFKLNLFVGYDENTAIQGTFKITPNTKVVDSVSANSKVISVDSTIGFDQTGVIISGINSITYTDKNINQFLGCSGIDSALSPGDDIRSYDEIYYGYEDGDLTKRVEIKLVGVLSKFRQISENLNVSEGDTISVSNLGEVIDNPKLDSNEINLNNRSYKEIFANSWIYNTSTRNRIQEFQGSTILKLASILDSSSIKVGDEVEILKVDDNNIQHTDFIKSINIQDNEVTLNAGFSSNSSEDYDLRRKIRKASSSIVPIEFGNDSVISDIQNVYNDRDEYFYVASNSLPSSDRGITDISMDQSYKINVDVKKATIGIATTSSYGGATGINSFSVLNFSNLPFKNGDEIYYKPSNVPIVGLDTGYYFVEKLDNGFSLRLYRSRSFIERGEGYVLFSRPENAEDGQIDEFILSSQSNSTISPQKLLKKFPAKVNTNKSSKELTIPGPVGMLINGVEIHNYKSRDKVYYGPLKSVDVLFGGNDYDVINKPNIKISSGSAKIQPVLSGSVKDVYVDEQEFDIDSIISIGVTGGNGFGAVLNPVLKRRSRQVFFDARVNSRGGGINTIGETITFLEDHNFDNGQEITYSSNGNLSLGIGTIPTGEYTLSNNSKYYTKVLNSKAIQIYETKVDYNLGINTVGFTTINAVGTHKFVVSSSKNTLSRVEVLSGGTYTNRELIIKPSNVKIDFDTINFSNHNFKTGDIVEYTYQTSAISGLSSSNQYFVLKQDDNSFRLCDAGIGGTITSNFEKEKYVNITSTGSGYQYFKYPDISVYVNYKPVGFGTTSQEGQTITLTPKVTGSIVDAYLYESGTGYGSTTINFEKKPNITIQIGKDARAIPNIIRESLDSVNLQYAGLEYYSTPDVEIVDLSGKGSGAKARAIISDNKLTEIKVINPGIGYSSTDTKLIIKSSGNGAKLDAKIRDLTINDAEKLGTELLLNSGDNLKYAVTTYNSKYFGEKNKSDDHSPIIGWAYDGNPIYGPFGYSDPNNDGEVREIKSGYTKNEFNIEDRPSLNDFDLGYFVEDYKFTNDGDLDEYNGRFAKTKDFPDHGVYAYYATVTKDNINVPVFPYFIGNSYKSPLDSDNHTINQSFDFENSNLVRNTFPYKVSDANSKYEFVLESDKVKNQKAVVESINDGSISDFDIINSGDNYNIKDTLTFESLEEGGGVSAQVSSVKGKEIVNIRNITENVFSDAIFEKLGDDKVKVNILPKHTLKDQEYVTISGLTNVSQLNDLFQIGITTYSAIVLDTVPASSGVGQTEIYVSNIPSSISIGSSVEIGGDSLKILKISRNSNILRVRGSIVGYSTGQTLNYISDSFTIDAKTNYFDSQRNNLAFFNAKESVGFGTTAGVSISTSFAYGINTIERSIPTQSIFIENHSFKNNQLITLTIPESSGRFSISTDSSNTFDLPSSGLTTDLYVTNKGKNIIGIKTGVGSSFGEVFFHGFKNGSGVDRDDFSIENNLNQITGTVSKISSVVAVSTAHGLSNGDLIDLSVQPNLNVGIGTSTQVRLKLSSDKKILVDNIGFNSTGINTNTNVFTINDHNFKTGDKVAYSSDLLPEGLNNSNYYVYRIDDNNFKLSETYYDSQLNSPQTIGIGSTGGESQNISLINSNIKVIKGNNLVFDTSDSSLSDYNLKIYTDNQFKNEFVSTGSTNNFNIVSSATTTTINYSKNLPTKLYYNLERSGTISTTDTDVKNYNEILYVDSVYDNEYTITGVGETTFTINLIESPEKASYLKSECENLSYTTTSKTAKGPINDIKLISKGSGYKSLPKVVSIASTLGNSATIKSLSNTIGGIKEFRIVNENFEYPSDTTLRPRAFISPLITLRDNNTVGFVSVTNGGDGYTTPPTLILIDSISRSKINSGLLRANIIGNSISSVDIEVKPTNISENPVEVIAQNNTSGISIVSVSSNSSGIFTCTITTPNDPTTGVTGFSDDPFTAGDLVFVEGIEKYSTDGFGFNSEDYGFKFFIVESFDNTTSPNNTVTLNVSGLTTNTGIAKTTQNSLATIIKESDYPKFSVIKERSEFLQGEKLLINNVEIDLEITQYSDTTIKVLGSYTLIVGEIIKGKTSGAIAKIESIDDSSNSGEFSINYSLEKNIGWSNNVGNLNSDIQVTPDNDYYQNLSYSIQSPIKYEDLTTPVNNLLHASGTKNFADVGISSQVSNVEVESDIVVSQIYDIIEEYRTDTIRNFDVVRDFENLSGSSKFIKFENRKLANHFKINSNLSVVIDDINDQFSNLKNSTEPDLFLDIDEITGSDKYTNLLIRVTNVNTNDFDFVNLIILFDGEESYLIEDGNISTASTISGYDRLGEFSIEEKITGKKYLRFTPNNPYDYDYDLKVLKKRFTNETTGISTHLMYANDLISSTKLVESSQTSVLVSHSTSDSDAYFANILVLDKSSNELNYVDLYLVHDGTDTYLSESYSDSSILSQNLIGSFNGNINNGNFELSFTNDSNNQVLVRSRIISVHNTTSDSSQYFFKSELQPDSSVRSVVYDSNHVSSSESEITLIPNLYKDRFNSSRLVVAVEKGSGDHWELHQLKLIMDENENTHIQTEKYLSIDPNYNEYSSITGLGTFGSVVGVGTTINPVFYNDSGATLKITTFSETFYTLDDVDNIPLSLTYGNNIESLSISLFNGINGDRGNKLDFNLTHGNVPIFAKTFDPSSSSILNQETGVFTIDSHFFRQGEELIYTPESTFAGIAASSMTYRNDSEGVEDTLPSTVFAIVNGDNSFQISTERAGTAVTFTDIGTGNAHKFEMAKKNEKSIITIDNIVQHPLSFTSVNHTLNGSIDSTSTSIFSLSGISSIKLGDILRVDDEYMKVTNVGFGTTTTGPISGVGTTALVDVTRGFVGSAASTHNSSGIATVYRGAYNISGNKIFFVDPPRGNANEARDIRNLEYPTSDFSGRVYFRSSYDSNEIFDDISDQFTGIGRTFNVTVGGANTSGAGTTETSGRSGILLINGIFQSPTTSNNPAGNYQIIDTEASGGDPGITTVIFRGMRQLDDSSVVVTSDFDVNQNQLPRGGIVVSLGSTGGLGYAPLAGASVTSVIDATGAFTSVGLGTTDNHGSGYSGIVSVSVYDPTQDVGGDPASINATVGVGGTLIFSVGAAGTGYNDPKIFVSEPSYENLSVVGISRLGEGLTSTTGIGLSMSVVVGASSTSVGIGSTHFEVQSFKMTNSGYSFRKGDKFTLAGLVTDGRLSEPLETFTLEVTDTYEDKFAFWRFGDLDYIDSIANYQNGTRRRFPLFYNNGQIISFEGDENANINFSNILIIFVNGILQTPGESYEFNGGTSFTFNEAPSEDDVVDIFFYRGTSGTDSTEVINIKPLIERGDDVQIIGINTSPITQDLRTIFDISSSDKIETNAYRGIGIEDQILRPISIIKQKRDRFANGDFVYKTRDSLEPEIYPTAKIIGNISSSGITSIFVDNAEFFDANVGSGETYNGLVVSGSPDPVAAGLTAIVGVGGTISDLTIVSGGSGYTSTPTISISAPPVGVGTFIKSDGTVGVGSTATATAIVSGGSISGFTITNPGLGYSETYPPQVIVSLHSPSFENIANFDVSATKGYSGIITGIGTTSISNNLALKFSLHKTSSYGSLNDLEVGYPIHISNTVVGSGVTSLHQSGVGTVGIGTTFVDNIYHVAEFSVQGSLGILTCYIQDTSVVGLATTGSIAHPVGEFSWGRLTNSSGLTRSSSPISIGVTGLTVDSGLTTFPTIQRRGSRIGIRDTGALKKKLN